MGYDPLSELMLVGTQGTYVSEYTGRLYDNPQFSVLPIVLMLTFEEQLSNTPTALEEYISLPDLGGEISIVEGQFSIKVGDIVSAVTGKIFYSFCEKIELLFDVRVMNLDPITWSGVDAELLINEYTSGEAIVLKIQGERVQGSVYHLWKKLSVSCNSFRWCYLNAPSIIGDMVKREGSGAPDRLVFQAGDYHIIYENTESYHEHKRHREISHICELTRQDGKPIAFEAAHDEIQLFSRFVSFFAGCQHAPFFIEGVNKGDVRYQFHAKGVDDSLTSVSSWKPFLHDKDLVSLWPLFRAKRYKSDDQYDVLNTLVHWYLQANMNKGLLEGAYILAFGGLDLASLEIVKKELSNQQVVEDFFKRLNLTMPITPEDLSGLRNQLVHYKKSNRRKFNALSFDDKVFRFEAVLQILELAILYWLGYEGHYTNRFGSKWRGAAVKLAPWILT